MLCSFVEGKNEKCAVYHPQTTKECGKFGAFRIYLKELKNDPFTGVKHTVFDHTVFDVRKNRKLVSYQSSLLICSELRSFRISCVVHHFLYTDWPDHTAPMDAAPIVGMMRYARTLAKGNPITVHCSAGIGRSATFIGIDYAMQRIQRDSNVSMIDILKELRNQRYQSVQGIIQYIFLHICVLEGFAYVSGSRTKN
ncbi:unnamed protein product [Strongylus vulgaris]|uniref:Protein-tyrosine phosphatase n=1 Tax=Strongylus vulgaris TaxID=40348 RepID=A0A3P7JXY7_STRVU|nr:unnamed protein product [Strongylus vulgaris]